MNVDMMCGFFPAKCILSLSKRLIQPMIHESDHNDYRLPEWNGIFRLLLTALRLCYHLLATCTSWLLCPSERICQATRVKHRSPTIILPSLRLSSLATQRLRGEQPKSGEIMAKKMSADYFTETRHCNWWTAVGGRQLGATYSLYHSTPIMIIGNSCLAFHFNEVPPLWEWPRFKEDVILVSADRS